VASFIGVVIVLEGPCDIANLVWVVRRTSVGTVLQLHTESGDRGVLFLSGCDPIGPLSISSCIDGISVAVVGHHVGFLWMRVTRVFQNHVTIVLCITATMLCSPSDTLGRPFEEHLLELLVPVVAAIVPLPVRVIKDR